MESVGSYEAKTHLPRLLERVSQGEEIVITKHGVPIARLVPFHGRATRNVAEVIAEIKGCKRFKLPAGVTIRDMIDEGRRP